jgi:dolichyl-phosphate-mannose-protein mannosyltransferase
MRSLVLPVDESSPRATDPALLKILAIAVLVRVLVAASAWLVTRDPTVFHSPDTITYVAPAEEILRSATFSVRGQPEIVRTPGYPLLLVPGLLLGHLEVITIILQIGLSALTVWGAFVIARRLFPNDRRAARIAATLYALEPLSVIYSAILLTETLFTVMIVWGIVLIVAYERGGSARTLACGTVALAASAYVRPASWLLPFALLIVLGARALFAHRSEVLRTLGLAGAAAAAVIAPWQLRNRAAGFHGMSAISGEYLYFYDAAALRARRNHTSFEATQTAMGWNNDSLYLALHPEQRSWRPGERFEFMASEGSREVREHIGQYALIHLAGMARVAFDPGAIDALKLYRLYPASGGLLSRILTEGVAKAIAHLLQVNPLAFVLSVVLAMALVAIYGLSLRGLVANRRFLDPAIAVLVITIAYFVVIAGGPAGLNRFRHPAMPFLCVLAAAGLTVTTPLRWLLQK